MSMSPQRFILANRHIQPHQIEKRDHQANQYESQIDSKPCVVDIIDRYHRVFTRLNYPIPCTESQTDQIEYYEQHDANRFLQLDGFSIRLLIYDTQQETNP